LLRLEVRRLRDLLSAKADSVYSLENRKQQLLLSMEERKQDIWVHVSIYLYIFLHVCIIECALYSGPTRSRISRII
jgi:hypothetical protein